MNEYRFSHIDNYKNAIGTPVIINKGEHKGKKGIVTNVLKSIFKRHGFVFEITLFHEADETPIIMHSGDYFNALFFIDITLEDGKKYVTMRGDIVTMHKYKHGGGFYVKYSEITKDETNNCTEYYEPNGFAHHYDCGMNIIKEWNEDTEVFGRMD